MNKREDILLVSKNLFELYGYKKVSMDEIAKKANVTKKTIYSYFKDKDELFKYFIDNELKEIKEKLEKLEKNKKSFIDKISLNILYMLKLRKESKIFNKLLDDTDEIKEKFIKLYDDSILEYIESKLIYGIEKNEIKKCNTNLTAFVIYKVFISIMFEYKNDIDENKVTSEVINILKNGLLN